MKAQTDLKSLSITVVICLTIAMAFAQMAWADGVLIQDENAYLRWLHAPGWIGAINFSNNVHYISHAHQHWWWYRTAGDSKEWIFPEHSPDLITHERVDKAVITWTNTIEQRNPDANDFDAELVLVIEEVAPGQVRLTEQMTIFNTETVPLTIALFNYLDSAAGGDRFYDSADLVDSDPTRIQITDTRNGDYMQFLGGNAHHYQATDVIDDLFYNELIDDSVTNLSDEGLPIIGEGNKSFGGIYQWDLVIPPGESATVTVGLTINTEVYDCFGIIHTDPNVCGGYGECIATDECSCDGDWVGSQCNQRPPEFIYVDSTAAPGGDGSDWSTAYKYLQDALADANSRPKPIEIWVAEGTYRPDQGEGIIPGDLDAFVANYFSESNKVWLNNGIGGFNNNGQYLGIFYSYGVALGDLDGDNDLDAFVANDWGSNKVWLNDGLGNFTDSGQSLGDSFSYGVALGDLDGDNDLDAFVANDPINKVWLNDGSGIFTDSGQLLGLSDSYEVALGDLDDDNDLDAFVANDGTSNQVWWNDGSGNFTDSNQSLGSSDSYGIALGDLDGDNDLDAFVVNGSGQDNKVWWNDGVGNFTNSGQNLGNSDSMAVALGDLDGDGDLDAFVANSGTSTSNKVWLNDGFGNFTDSGQSLGNSYSEGVALGDLDIDGDLDAFVANRTGQANQIWFNNGSGIFTNSGQSLGNSSSYDVKLGDLDRDSQDSNGDKNATFQLISGVAIYGGFPSGGDIWENRDPNLYKTILSGDLLGDDPNYSEPDDMLNDPNRLDNSYHVVTGSGTEPNAILSGFTITGGHAARGGYEPNDQGGGMYNNNGSPKVTNCTFSGNSANQNGGGMFNNFYSSPTITNCAFIGNSILFRGGGMGNWNYSSPKVTNCTFSGNSANDTGGGMFNNFYSSPTITNCTFTGNSADFGGGMENWNDSSPKVTSCTFSGNSSNNYGGGMGNHNQSNPTITNCTFSQNSATQGGGIHIAYSNMNLINCIFWNNTATDSNGPQIALENSNAVIAFSDIQGGQSDIYTKGTSTIDWGAGNINEPPLFIDPNGPDGGIGTADDNLRIASTSPCVDAGDNGAIDPTITTDVAGKPRFIDNPVVEDTGAGVAPVVDMGAYEVQNIYVDVNISSGNVDGSSWEDAYFSVQDGLYEAREGGANIFVAEGIYTPDSDMFGNSIGDPNTTFQLINGVGLYGGFPSGGSDWESRSPSTYETILSGDLLLDDVDVNDPRDLLTEPTRADNSIHVVTGSGTDFTAILDGFTITAGNANGVTFYDSTGGGMFNYTGNPSVNNCTFSGNSAINGGGMASSHSSPIVIACVFTSNSSVGPGSQYGGGGMYNAGGSPIITNCTFSGNSAVSALDNSCGGGMYNNASELTVTNCVFSRNSADGGAGMYNNTYADATITNCTFSGNSANDEGGGMSNFNSDPIVVNCTFSGNSADSGGGMFNLDKSEPKITNCIFWANVAMSYGNEIYNASYWPLISYCDIEDSNGSGTGWDTSLGTDLGGNIDVDPLFFNSDANDFHLLPNSPCIDAGDNNVVSQSDDLDGLPRIVDGDCDITPRVDMGVYEFDWLYVGDFEGNDCDVDLTDFSVLADNFQQDNPDIDIAPFLNPDGIIDFKELQILCDNWLTQIP